MRILLFAGWIALAMPGLAQAGQNRLTERARVADAFGTVQKRASSTAAWLNVSVGDLLASKTTLRTGDDSAALLMLPNRHMVRVGSSTTVELRELGKENAFSFNVLSGRIWSLVRPAFKPAKYEVETPSAVVGVSGTVFSVFHDTDSTETLVTADEGTVRVSQGGRMMTDSIGKGTFGRIGLHAAWEAGAQPQMMRNMWLMMRRQEGWLAGRRPRMNRQFEHRLHQIRFHTAHIRRHPMMRTGPGRLRTAPPERIAPRRPPRGGLNQTP